MADLFKIDGAGVAGFELGDTRHQVLPGALATVRLEGFAGSRNRFAVKGRATRGRRVAEGTLRADSFDLLYDLIVAHETLVDTADEVAVTFHTKTYTRCLLVAFEVTGRVSAYSDDNSAAVKARVPARFTFEVLA